MKRFNSFLASSALSITFILLTVVLLTQMPQGSTLLIDLLNHPWQWLLFILLYHGFALALAHYPVYIHEFRSKAWKRDSEIDQNSAIYTMSAPKWLGLGFITYKELSPPAGAGTFSNFRKILGLAWHVGLLYIFLKIMDQMDPGPDQSVFFFSLVLWGVLSLLYVLVRRKLATNKNPNHFPNQSAMWVFIFSVLYLVALVVSFIFIYKYQWSTWSLYANIMVFVVGMLFYNVFSMVRTKMAQWIWWPVTWFGNHLIFLYFIAFLGWVSLFIAIKSTLEPMSISPLLTLISFYYLFYGVAIIILKHYFFHSQSWRQNTFIQKLLEVVSGSWMLLLVGVIIFMSINDNRLHSLPMTGEDQPLHISEYIKDFDLKGRDTIYLISSYGGGLKANAWNTLLFEEWSRGKNHQDILSKTFSMSGVSGGALGQAFYLASLIHEPAERREILNQMVQENFLTVDLAYLLGWDLIREAVPHCLHGEFDSDRALRSMELYEQTLNLKGMTTTPFRNYWRELYFSQKEKNIHVPALFVNSTATHHQRAVGSSLNWDNFHAVFPGADNLTEIKNTETGKNESVSYAHMVSCANRFPIFSPGARIEGKGHYLDGGYFENSRLLTSWNIYQYLKDQDEFCPDKVIFLNIINDRASYIEHVYDWRNKTKEVKSDGEISSILGTITNIDAWPNYWRKYVELKSCDDECLVVKDVFLPYRIDRDDVYSRIRGTLTGTEAKDFDEKTDSNNCKIECWKAEYVRHYGWKNYDEVDMVEPPLARILTKPAVDYMKAMIYGMKEDGSL